MRLLPALGLFLLAPLVAEFLLGNLPITALSSLVLLAPLYGGGALLIREVARRTGRGWPTILLLGLAYGIVEEGVTTQSLFDPDYAGQRLLDHGFVPGLGIGVPWTLFVLTLHTVWSIATPIALVETLARRPGPWLRTPGLVVTAVLFVIGLVGTTVTTLQTDHFVAPAGRLVGAVAVAVLVAAAAFVLPGRFGAATLRAPHPLVLLGVSLAAGAVFELLPLSWWGVPVWVVLAAAAVVLLPRWARDPEWSQAHVLALAAGATLTYAWHAFGETPVLPASPAADLVGNGVFAAGAVALLIAAAIRVGDPLHRFETKSSIQEHTGPQQKRLRWRAER
ncbi:hypothetical protein [Pseudonocardia pini]|uniref:hypothetical protein n=1 Tax=Pseudonocardia pini TaxID=2758030 RepID=UPI0015EFE032|nr:hypothetical protein [Pseudonocardia pini]